MNDIFSNDRKKMIKFFRKKQKGIGQRNNTLEVQEDIRSIDDEKKRKGIISSYFLNIHRLYIDIGLVLFSYSFFSLLSSFILSTCRDENNRERTKEGRSDRSKTNFFFFLLLSFVFTFIVFERYPLEYI